MATAQPTSAQQGVTKTVGSNAAFNDKVRNRTDHLHLPLTSSRANRWNSACRIWSRRRVRSSLMPEGEDAEDITAISDAVRTSLGPRGMDKMVSTRPAQIGCAFLTCPDPNIERRGDRHKRWCNHPQEHPGPAPRCEDGKTASYNESACPNFTISSSIFLPRKMLRRAMERPPLLSLLAASLAPPRRCLRRAFTPRSSPSPSSRRPRRPSSTSPRFRLRST